MTGPSAAPASQEAGDEGHGITGQVHLEARRFRGELDVLVESFRVWAAGAVHPTDPAMS